MLLMNKENCALKLVDEIILFFSMCACVLGWPTGVMYFRAVTADSQVTRNRHSPIRVSVASFMK